jgi:hypothetical protein
LEQNPYAAPSLDVDARAEQAKSSGTMQWFAVGTRKLWVMSLLTFGIYPIYWFERQYRMQKRARWESTWPLARAIFAVFFAHELFRRVESAAARVEIHPSWSSGVLGTIFVVSAVVSRILDKVTDKLVTGTVGSVLTALSIVLVLGLAYPIVQVQGTVNRLLSRERPDYDKNERFTVWNWLAIGAGSLILALAVYGLVAPDEDPKHVDGATIDVSRP